MSSDFDDALQQARQLQDAEQRAFQEAVAQAQRNKRLARSTAEPYLRELGPKVAQKLKDLGVPLNDSPPGSTPVRYWDFKPHFVILSEDGCFMRPYTIEHDFSQHLSLTPNTGRGADQEFELFLDQIELFDGERWVSAIPAAPRCGSYGDPHQVLPGYKGIVLVDRTRRRAHGRQ